MLDGVLDGTLNAAFADGPITHPGLEGMPVYREEMMIVTPHGHPPHQTGQRCEWLQYLCLSRQLFLSSPL